MQRRHNMDSEELVELMEKIEAKGISPEKVEEQTKVSYDLLKLYANSGPVPVTILKKLQTMLEEKNE
jgi:hypothetical protein